MPSSATAAYTMLLPVTRSPSLTHRASTSSADPVCSGIRNPPFTTRRRGNSARIRSRAGKHGVAVATWTHAPRGSERLVSARRSPSGTLGESGSGAPANMWQDEPDTRIRLHPFPAHQVRTAPVRRFCRLLVSPASSGTPAGLVALHPGAGRGRTEPGPWLGARFPARRLHKHVVRPRR